MIHVESHGRLQPSEIDEVTSLVAAVAEADGVAPLSEHVLLHLRHGGDTPVRNLLARADDAGAGGAGGAGGTGGALVGYAHLDVTDPVEGSSAELAVAPTARRRGVAGLLVDELLEQSGGSVGGRLRLWAHGQQPGAERLAASRGFDRARVLWQMRRSLLSPLPTPALPPGVSIRTFKPGVDEQAWVTVNNAAFIDHPDQGRWSEDDLLMREAEPWFDPAGFFLAERDARLVGFHWTKVHGEDLSSDHGHPPIGEVYVVGVDPSEAGRGLGPALTLVGLQHLRSSGLTSAMLYVDESNTRAVRVYERLGFVRWAADVLYARG